MNTVSVFRVEHNKLGHGPWMATNHHDFSTITADELYEIGKATDVLSANWKLNLKRYPNPYGDRIGFAFTPGKHFCAVKTLRHLRKWFRESASYIDALFDAGFTVMEYVVPADDVLDGAAQVVFSKANVIKAIDHTLLALFKN